MRTGWMATAIAVTLLLTTQMRAADVKVLLPEGRTVFQTNEVIDLTCDKPLPPGPLKVSLTGEDGSRVEMVFGAKATPAQTPGPVRLNGWLLRPGKYTMELTAAGATGQAQFELCSHVRMSDFKVMNRTLQATPAEQVLLGERGLGFNQVDAGIKADPDALLRGGLELGVAPAGGMPRPEWFVSRSAEPSSNQRRLERYLSFMMRAQETPDVQSYPLSKLFETDSTEGIIEANRLMGRLGPIFTTMPADRGQVAVWCPPSTPTDAIALAYQAAKRLHIQPSPIAEGDVQNGTLSAHHKVLLLASTDELDARVTAALEAYIDGGGVVLVSDDAKVKIKGATLLGYALRGNDPQSLANALKAKLDALEIKPFLGTDHSGIIVSRQAWGDIEYLFAVNATEGLTPADATLSMPADERILYDAIHSRLAKEFVEKDGTLSAKLRFGPGQMRVFARTNKTIGGVDLPNPLLVRDFTKTEAPVRLNIVATVVDSHNAVLAGSVPMHIQIIDPLRMVRYELYRATDQGVLRLSLPLAANDPAGQWRIIVRELLSGTQGTNSFTYAPASPCGAVGGLVASEDKLDLPTTATITPASKSTARGPEAKIAWRAILPDRALSIDTNDKGGLTLATNDGSLVQLDAAGQIVGQTPASTVAPKLTPPTVPDLIAKNLHPARIVKFIQSKDDRTAVAYWGGTVEVFDGKGQVKTSQLLPHDVAGMKWLGTRLVIAQSDGSVIALAIPR